MKLIALTGGLGMGKSTAADWLRQREVPLVDSDLIAREITEPGQPLLAEIRAAFGDSVLDADGRLKRAALAQVVFALPEARKKLEALMHPRIQEAWKATAQQWRQAGRQLGVAVIPLLFETRGETSFDAVVCIACSTPVQRQRLLARGWSDLEIQQRIQAQMPVSSKMARADFVVWNEVSLDLLAAQMEMVFSRWMTKEGRPCGNTESVSGPMV